MKGVVMITREKVWLADNRMLVEHGSQWTFSQLSLPVGEGAYAASIRNKLKSILNCHKLCFPLPAECSDIFNRDSPESYKHVLCISFRHIHIERMRFQREERSLRY